MDSYSCSPSASVLAYLLLHKCKWARLKYQDQNKNKMFQEFLYAWSLMDDVSFLNTAFWFFKASLVPAVIICGLMMVVIWILMESFVKEITMSWKYILKKWSLLVLAHILLHYYIILIGVNSFGMSYFDHCHYLDCTTLPKEPDEILTSNIHLLSPQN